MEKGRTLGLKIQSGCHLRDNTGITLRLLHICIPPCTRVCTHIKCWLIRWAGRLFVSKQLIVCEPQVSSGTCANGVKVGIRTSLGNLPVDSESDHGPAEMSAFVRCVSGVLCYEAASHRSGFSFYCLSISERWWTFCRPALTMPPLFEVQASVI